MKDIVTFDTNFIIENKSGIGDIIKDIQKKYDTLIIKLVVEEIKGQKVRDTLKEYKLILDKINEAKQKNEWLKIIDTTNIDKILQEQERRLESWINRIFNGNIIEVDYKELITEVMDRCKYKKPPFNEAKGSSDKGFKDTLLFLTFVNYLKENENKKIYFLTNDKIFITHKKEIEKEFKDSTGKEFIIISGDKDNIYKQLGIENTSDIKVNNEELEIFPEKEGKEDIKKEVSKILNNIFTKLNLSQNGSFIIWKRVQDDTIKEFLDSLPSNIEKYIFLSDILISNIINIQCTDGKIDIRDLEEINKLYISMSEEDKEALVFAFTTMLNDYLQELPF